MTFEDPILFEKAGEKLLSHLEHKVTLTAYGGECAPDSIPVECENCCEVLTSPLIPRPSMIVTI